METRWVQLCTLQQLRYREIANRCCAILRLHTSAAQFINPLRNLEIGTQFRDSEIAQNTYMHLFRTFD